MSRHEHVFIASEEPVEVIARSLEAALGGTFTANPDGEQYLLVGPSVVFLSRHDFDDEDHPDVALSSYPYMVVVHDRDKDHGRQTQVARRVFDIVQAAGRWKAALLFHDLQHLVAVYDPDTESPAR